MNAQNRLTDNLSFLKFMQFSGVDEKAIGEKMEREKGAFLVNGVMNVNDGQGSGQMAYTLFFSKYDQPDTHLPDKFRVALVDEPQRQGLFLFDDRHPITATDAFHLLHGRAIMKAEGDAMQLWYQMDFKKRDGHGDGLVQMFSLSKSDFDVENKLKQFSIKELQHADQKSDLLARLFSGRTVMVSVQQAGDEKLMLLQPNPKDRTVHVREYIERKSESVLKEQIRKKQSWEIPIEKRNRKKGLSL